ncbi:MAG: glutathione synthase [Myxococcaceae bacterium]
MRVGFLMDPLEDVRVEHDTTFALMLEAERRGHTVFAFEQTDLCFQRSGCWAQMREVDVRREPGDHFTVLSAKEVALSALDVVFLRKDPPVDSAFLHATQLVELGPRPPFFINSPRGLRDANEKLFSLRYPDLIPPTLISRDPAQIKAFVQEVGGDAILKPIDGFGGKSVLRVRPGDPNAGSMIEIMTESGRSHTVVQAFLPASRTGDKRIIVLDGEPLGAVLRVPLDEEVRANMAVGGAAVRTTLTLRERDICARITPDLRAHGLHFVGLDVIGDTLTEINVTSPTGLVEIEHLDGTQVAAQVLAFAEEQRKES